MLLELKRFIQSAYGITAFGLTALFFVSAYGMASVPNPQGVPYNQFYEALYMIYCQFGQMILSAYAMYFVTKEYSDTTILFYRKMGINAAKFYVCKVFVLFIAFFSSYLVCSAVACAAFHDVSLWGAFALQTGALLLTYFSIFCFAAVVVGKFVPSYFLYLVWWLTLSTPINYGVTWAEWLQPFDENATLYTSTVEHLADTSTFLANQMSLIGTYALYALGICGVGIVICSFAQKRWIRNGVK